MQCFNEYSFLESQTGALPTYYNTPNVHLDIPGLNLTTPRFAKLAERKYPCDGPIYLDAITGEVRIASSTTRDNAYASFQVKARAFRTNP